MERLNLRRVPQFGDAELLRWIFDPHLVPNNHSAVNAHVHMWHPSVRSRDPCVKACRCNSLDLCLEAIDLTRNTHLSLVVGFAGPCTWRSLLVYMLTVNGCSRTEPPRPTRAAFARVHTGMVWCVLPSFHHAAEDVQGLRATSN